MTAANKRIAEQTLRDRITAALPRARSTDMMALVARTLHIRRVSRQAYVLCPWHRERTPSCAIYPDHFHCYACGEHGDAITWLMRTRSIGFLDAVEHLTGESLLLRRDVDSNESPPVRSQSDDQRIRNALTTFAEAGRMPGTPAETYLIRRIGSCIDWPADLRFHPSCGSRFGADHEWQQHPALIALLRDIHTNEPRAIHRTFLLPDGSDRLRCFGGKKALGPMRGCVLKLSPDDAVTDGLHIAEGLETSLSLLAKGFAPMWATVGTVGKFPVLPGVEALTIFADHDTNNAGSKAAHECAVRWRDAGRGVVSWTPRSAGTDWNDVFRSVS